MKFSDKVNSVHLQPQEIAVFFIAQAGFCIKTSSGKIIYIDPYLSDACERLFRFKRMIPAMVAAEDVEADFYLVTHHHADHLDPDSIPVVVKNQKTTFVIAPDCTFLLEELQVPTDRYHVLQEGEQVAFKDIIIRAIYADHGDLAPQALGYLIEIEGIKIYHAGDTAFRPGEIMASLNSRVDIMIAPINGQYGNMNAAEAWQLALEVKPKVVIPCHFWMFLEHVSDHGVGDPATFLKVASQLPADIIAKVMAPGEYFIFSQTGKALY